MHQFSKDTPAETSTAHLSCELRHQHLNIQHIKLGEKNNGHVDPTKNVSSMATRGRLPQVNKE